MESKKKPLWLTLKDADTGADIALMLKVGDDLRQDALIMQLLRVMSDLWKKEGLDMQMMLYDCISTGNERGLLQIVGNANTLGKCIYVDSSSTVCEVLECSISVTASLYSVLIFYCCLSLPLSCLLLQAIY